MNMIQQLLIVCPLVFMAGFIDSIAGGGGLISLPAYYLIGLPPHMALGTNKMSSSMGTVMAAAQYIRKKYFYKDVILVSIAAALVGSFTGSQAALLLDEIYLKYIMTFFVPAIALMTVLKKDFLNTPEKTLSYGRANLLAGISSLLIGFYDGFFGPGTGMFLMLVYVSFMGMNVVTACGNTKVVNLATNIAALVTFILSGKVAFHIAVPCGICSIIGSYLGAHLAMKRGLSIIKPVMLVVITLLMLSIGKDVFTSFQNGKHQNNTQYEIYEDITRH